MAVSDILSTVSLSFTAAEISLLHDALRYLQPSDEISNLRAHFGGLLLAKTSFLGEGGKNVVHSEPDVIQVTLPLAPETERCYSPMVNGEQAVYFQEHPALLPIPSFQPSLVSIMTHLWMAQPHGLDRLRTLFPVATWVLTVLIYRQLSCDARP